QEVQLPAPYRPSLFLIPLGEKAKHACFKILHHLRKDSIHAQMDFSGRKLSKVMSHADQISAQFVAVVGEQELENQTVEPKNMATGETVQAPLFHLSRILCIESQEQDFLKMWADLNAPFKDPLEAKFFHDKIKSSIDHTQKLTKELQEAMEKM